MILIITNPASFTLYISMDKSFVHLSYIYIFFMCMDNPYVLHLNAFLHWCISLLGYCLLD